MNAHIYLSVDQIVKKYPISMPKLRVYLKERKVNGLNKAVRKMGNALWIREDLWIDWIESHAEVKEEKKKKVK